MTKRTLNQQYIWLDKGFFEWFRDLKRTKSAKDKKDYSDPDISAMLLKMPEMENIKKKLLDQNNIFTAQIRIQMDRRRKDE